MAGNSFGQLFKITTFGESHGPAIGVVIDGVPPKLPLTEADIQKDLDRRRPGQSKITTQRREPDKAEILSGVFEGKTTGAPLAILIRNTDARSKDYENIKDVFRPGHADFSYMAKYGIRDHRGGGRSSGRETACRVAAGAVAKKILAGHKVGIIVYTLSVAGAYAQEIDYSVIEKNAVRTADMKAAGLMIAKIEEARKNGDSLGSTLQCVVKNCPAGLGDPCFDKLNARLAQALMSIATVKGIEFGDGFAASQLTGSINNDRFVLKGKKVGTATNHSGGIMGGISTGEDITIRMALKPPSSISRLQKTINEKQQEVEVRVKGRHDPCLAPRVVPVAEAMIALTLVDCLMIQKATNL
ncbi:MAG: chorismate synthase [Candidatus Omnitrophica bacterium]|nr:chorismate synthase [Candidatus Omnitrophota bacterium]MDE2009344.1 chorismate synthase [Candidatus Omnitrophota bacterium]MDE2214128.1 chorismate synthase [Candidatus Omnitrophota bacterium]MDE2231165.1 chorismate synthase [Candidatus Omnitrophota bacterium]